MSSNLCRVVAVTVPGLDHETARAGKRLSAKQKAALNAALAKLTKAASRSASNPLEPLMGVFTTIPAQQRVAASCHLCEWPSSG